MVSAVLKGMKGLGLFRVAEVLARREPLVVLVHGVSARDDFEGTENYCGKHVPVRYFRAWLEWLRTRFDIVPLAEVERLVVEHARPTRPVCSITFDDGYRNNFTNAFPVLREMGLPATLFVTTGFVDHREPLWVDRLEYALNRGAGSIAEKIAEDMKIRSQLKTLTITEREVVLGEIVARTSADLRPVLDQHDDYAPLSWDQIREMSRAGIAIGAHTVTHPILSRETKDVQQREIVESAERIRALVGECRHFAYPDGQPGTRSAETIAALRIAGFTAAWTTEMRRVRPMGEQDAYALPRIALDAGWKGVRFEALATNTLPLLKRVVRRVTQRLG